MVTLHLLKSLANNGFGTIDTDLFWEEVPLDSEGNPREGLWIVTRGSAVTRYDSNIQAFDIYARYANKIKTQQKLNDILKYFWSIQGETCTLPTVPPYSLSAYTNVRIFPTSSVENVGSDEQDKIVKVISGEIRFKEEQ